MNVSAKDKASGKSQSVKIQASTNLSKEEVERLKSEASAHAAEDARRRELAETKNQAEASVYMAEKALKDGGDKIPADVKAAVQEKIAALKKANEGENLEGIKSALDALTAEVQKVGQSFYNKNQDNPQKNDQGPQQPPQAQE